MPTDVITWLVMAAGAFTVALGIWHVGVPRRFGFRKAIEPWRDGQVAEVRLGPWRYPATRADVMGVALVMNAATTYTLVSIGVICLVAPAWLATPAGPPIALWLAGWWGIRAAMQLQVGRRRVDTALVGAFGALAALFLVAATA